MGAAVVGIGEQQFDGCRPVPLFRLFGVGFHLAHVIGVAEGDIALPGIDGFDLSAVVAGRSARKIITHARKPFLGCLFTCMRNDGGDKADRIDMLSGTGANFALPFGISQFLIGDAVLWDTLF